MTIRKAMEIFPTMTVEGEGENKISFKEMEAVITLVEDVETKYGKNCKARLENDAESLTFEVFLNNFSMQNLITSFGEDDVKWVGNKVDLKKDTDKKYGKEMIILVPKA